MLCGIDWLADGYQLPTNLCHTAPQKRKGLKTLLIWYLKVHYCSHKSLSWMASIQFKTLHTISCTSILTLFTNFPYQFSLKVFPPNSHMHFILFICMQVTLFGSVHDITLELLQKPQTLTTDIQYITCKSSHTCY